MAESGDLPCCIFCRITGGKDDKTELVHEDEQFVAFRDIHPAAEHHYLVVPKQHVGNPKTLGQEHRELGQSLFLWSDSLGKLKMPPKIVTKMVGVGKLVIEKQGGNPEAARYGFHWPPFNTVQHLHLHAVFPVEGMGFISRLIYRPNSFWFVTADWLLKRLSSV
eukprot:m.23051 g.23051  ORF g.23051 m.23051 type:complete len:164 (+) comp28432_c0_seq8:789-1280(+)